MIFYHFVLPQYELACFFLVHLFHTISSAWYLRQNRLEDFWTKINEFLWVDELKGRKGDDISIIHLAESWI